MINMAQLKCKLLHASSFTTSLALHSACLLIIHALNPLCPSGLYLACASTRQDLRCAAAGLSVLQALYVTCNPDGDKFKLPYCILVFGFFQFVMSQLPDLHSLRFMGAVSNVCTLAFTTIAAGMSIHNGTILPHIIL